MSDEKAESLGVDREGVRPTAASLINSKNHRPGRELDALVAERVLGITVVWQQTAILDDAPHYEIEGQRLLAFLPSYSTDMAAAWKVWEHLARHIWTIGLEYMMTAQGWRYRCDLHRTSDGYTVDEFAETAPLAICLAALRALDA